MVRWNSHARLYSFRLVFGKACSFHLYKIVFKRPDRSAEAVIAKNLSEVIVACLSILFIPLGMIFLMAISFSYFSELISKEIKN